MCHYLYLISRRAVSFSFSRSVRVFRGSRSTTLLTRCCILVYSYCTIPHRPSPLSSPVRSCPPPHHVPSRTSRVPLPPFSYIIVHSIHSILRFDSIFFAVLLAFPVNVFYEYIKSVAHSLFSLSRDLFTLSALHTTYLQYIYSTTDYRISFTQFLLLCSPPRGQSY